MQKGVFKPKPCRPEANHVFLYSKSKRTAAETWKEIKNNKSVV